MVQYMIEDFIVIGAGLSGLNMARKINELGMGSVLVLEKSRGVGGRMATRRTLETRFDHGAQFYKVKSEISELHQLWKSKQINHQWFVSSRGDHWGAKLGMTALAKGISENVRVNLEKQIRTIHFENNIWKLISDKDEHWFCRNLIISSPLPQTIKLLEEISSAEFFNTLAFTEIKKMNYTKALIGLVTLENDIMLDSYGYREFQEGAFFSISDQKKKGISEIPALTITMSPSFSEVVFEEADDIVLKKILDEFLVIYPEAKIKGAELKKWRYCRPTSQFETLFLEIAPKLYLMGDAFGGSSLLGAIRSSDALCSFLVDDI